MDNDTEVEVVGEVVGVVLGRGEAAVEAVEAVGEGNGAREIAAARTLDLLSG